MNVIQLTQRTRRFAALCSLLLLAIPAIATAADRMASGKWEAVMTTDGDTRTVTFCISAAEAASINGGSLTGRDFAEQKAKKSGSPCVIKAYDIKADTVSYILSCGPRTITDSTSFHGDTSEGVKTIVNAGTTITTRVKSRRIGACP